MAREALQALQVLGIDENLVGHVMDSLMVTLTVQGRTQEAIDIARPARRLLEREGDELRLLDTLALNAAYAGRGTAAAQLARHVDSAMAQRGETRWPAAAARRAQLQARLEAELETGHAQQQARGAVLTREQAFALAFDDHALG